MGGRQIEMLFDGEQSEPYRYEVGSITTVASGVYFVRLQTGGMVLTRKMVSVT